MSCNDKNSLTREGISLFNRVLAALNTNYAKVDERTDADIILFAKRYAAYLNYYDASNTLTGDWQSIMKMDACVALAALFKIESSKIYDYKLLLFKQIKLASLEAVDADNKTKKQFKFLFDFIFSLVKFVDEQYSLVPDDLSKKDVLKGAISSKMSESLTNLLALYQKFSTTPLSLIDTTVTTLDYANTPVNLISSTSFDKTLLNDVWITTPPLSYSITDAIAIPDKTATFTEKNQIVWLVNHNLFSAQLDNLFKSIAFLATRAKEIFDMVIADYPNHSPHYTLFLSFIKLFYIAQDDLNRYTQRHLDFYYKDVLQLKNKQPQPDVAHLTFELQKPVDQHLLQKDTLFKGGKDSTGKEVQYAATQDVVLNKAAISKLQSWQLTDTTKQILKASVIANSNDGQGAKIDTVDKSWFTFGDTRKISNAETGFGIASNVLFLNEGYRKVTCIINFENNISEFSWQRRKFKINCFKAKITGSKGWIDIPNLLVSIVAANKLSFHFELDAKVPAIIPYTEEIHKSNLNVSLPLLQVYLEQDDTTSMAYTFICKKKISSADITVNVTGVKNLSLSHDNGDVDAAKPFKPFGDFPSTNSSFFIGSKEVFQKKLSFVKLNFAWGDNIPSINTTINYLKDNNWETGFNSTNDTIDFTHQSFSNIPISFEDNEPLQTNSIQGFLRLRISNDNFSYQKYLDDVLAGLQNTILLKDGVTHDPNIKGLPAPKPVMSDSFTLDYVATASITFPPDRSIVNDLFFHFTPFGYYQVSPDMGSNASNAEAIEHITLLPDIINAGELFIGLENTEPGAVVTILMQVADGSSNPLKDIETVNWYYLVENNWKEFSKQVIADGTNNLIQPGIVTVKLPQEISSINTAFETGFYWIKATVKNNTDAVCKLILVQAQAALVQLLQDDTRQIEFRQTLPANSISKLVVGDAAIKTITQPFDSFEGRLRETDEHFYVRISERLRHKQRAINIWDYEHIVMEQFESIFKVKCLNQSGFYTKDNEDVFCENYPGHVSIITISNQKNKVNINPLKPYTSIQVLNNIAEFLKKTNSPFVKLHVKNPQFEEIQLDFKVKFYDLLDESFYLNLLNNEIEKFLCPWAFDQDKEISFGGKIVKSSLLNFVEERPYVDFVTCFKMNHIIKREGNVNIIELQDVEEAIASTSRSLFVSYFNEETNVKHKIISPALCDC